MSNGNLIKENGFFFLNAKIVYPFSMQQNVLFTIYFIDDFMIYEMDTVPGKINLNQYLFEPKYKNRKYFEEKLIKDKMYSPFTNIRKAVGQFEVHGTEISCDFIGQNSDYPNVKVYLKRMWLPLFGTDYYLTVHDEYSSIIKSEKMTFCSYP